MAILNNANAKSYSSVHRLFNDGVAMQRWYERWFWKFPSYSWSLEDMGDTCRMHGRNDKWI